MTRDIGRCSTRRSLDRASLPRRAQQATGSVVTSAGSGKTANFGLALPLTWNSKFLFSGCGGLCGVVFQTPPADARGGGYPMGALAKGYAIAATDDGHASNPVGFVFDGTWALTAPGVPNSDAVADLFHRAVHAVTTGTAPLPGWKGRSVETAATIADRGGAARNRAAPPRRNPTACRAAWLTRRTASSRHRPRARCPSHP